MSVLLPVRDGAEHLEEALDSLLRQTLRDFEVVAVDDGSEDDTPKILDAHAATDSRLRPIRLRRSGIVVALETARSAARGRYLARMDADDVAEPARLERQLSLMEARPGLTACGTRVEYFPRGSVKDGALRYQRWINGLVDPDRIEADIFVECPLPHPTFFLRAVCVDAVGGYRDRGWPEDYDLLLRLRERGGRFGKVPEVLLRWRESPDRLSRIDDAYSAAAFRRCKVHFLARGPLAGREGAVVWGTGPTGKAFGKELLRQRIPIVGWVDPDPRKIGQEIHGARVVHPDDAQSHVGSESDARGGAIGVRNSGVAAPGPPLHLGAVGREGVRAEIRERAAELGLREGEDFVAVA